MGGGTLAELLAHSQAMAALGASRSHLADTNTFSKPGVLATAPTANFGASEAQALGLFDRLKDRAPPKKEQLVHPECIDENGIRCPSCNCATYHNGVNSQRSAKWQR